MIVGIWNIWRIFIPDLFLGFRLWFLLFYQLACNCMQRLLALLVKIPRLLCLLSPLGLFTSEFFVSLSVVGVVGLIGLCVVWGVSRAFDGPRGVIGVALSFDLGKEVSLVADEERMLKDLVLRATGLRLVEVVHVQLSNEWRKVVVLKVLRQDLLWEGYLVLYHEAVTLC